MHMGYSLYMVEAIKKNHFINHFIKSFPLQLNWSGDDSASCYIRYYDARSKVLHKAARIANWNFLTNITEENAEKKNKKFNGTDYKNLEYYWTAFRNETGRKLKTLYQEFVVLLKEIAVAHGKNDMGQIWRDWYGDENFREEISRLWKEVKPFYEQLHAYVRHKLHNFYKDVPEAKDFKADGLIPAHLLGDLYSQVWHRKFDLLKLADVETVDVTKALKQSGPHVIAVFCPPVSITGFHEAIGDLISLSVNTPTHLKSLGLYNTSEEGSNETANDLNFLLRTALKKVAFMPYSYIMDKYRWSLFEGEILPEELNAAWWKLRQEEQGIKAPNLRTEEDFDIGSKWHIVSNFGYVRYFVANVLQFSFHKHFCKIAGQYDEENPDAKPLHLCDISAGSYPTAVGEDFRKLLSLGASVPDDKQLEMFTGSSKMTMEAVLEYFRPLRIEIERYNKENNVPVGWKSEL
ncbi:unnamed protein product [Cyprideis torosa]|uniref:Uncharacterized protein n=1 Tax=Cyprideis torosa TaxID=163714 RepID=A0A7R8WK72_9CRUS|nr:unnamed protein product [Cyprideis torosa]CAG0895745.1 unnamed protein product [Cyprideis torosa]